MLKTSPEQTNPPGADGTHLLHSEGMGQFENISGLLPGGEKIDIFLLESTLVLL